jgi:hypothetical protein
VGEQLLKLFAHDEQSETFGLENPGESG